MLRKSSVSIGMVRARRRCAARSQAQIDDRRHSEGLDEFDDIARDRAPPFHMVELAALRARRQCGSSHLDRKVDARKHKRNWLSETRQPCAAMSSLDCPAATVRSMNLQFMSSFSSWRIDR